MRLLQCVAFLASAASIALSADTNSSKLASQKILPSTFTPPQAFKNVNSLRNVNLDKGYIKESVNVVIQNIDKQPQSEYFVPFSASVIPHVGGFSATDKKDTSKVFASELVEYDATSATQFYRIKIDPALPAKAQTTLAINYHIISSLQPLPASIKQNDKQYLNYKFSAYIPSAYLTASQKTKIKFPNTDVPDYTGKPDRSSSTYTYGPFNNIPAGAEQLESVRYEFTKPLIHAKSLERDIEISHWGGNAAFEERYQLTNQGASLLPPGFNRVAWAQQAYYNPATSAIKELKVPLKAGSMSAYFTDDIGNISTSHFRQGPREALLELKPRYPIFGGWNFPFRIGWDADLKNFLKIQFGGKFVLKVPYLDGPKMGEGVSYAKVVTRIILPEGAMQAFPLNLFCRIIANP
jgi:oligosaccharyltransferase complex subunit alpha (ribophorin I)